MPIPNIRDIIDKAGEFNWVALADAASMFYQFKIDNSLRKFFGARVSSLRGEFKKVMMNVLPMGACFAPALAQHISLQICNIVRSRTKLDVAVFSWIDNFMIFC